MKSKIFLLERRANSPGSRTERERWRRGGASLKQQHRASDVSKRSEGTPLIRVIGATAIAATVTDPSQFKSGRGLAAWIGLVPRQYSTGVNVKLGCISKQGDRYLRRLLVVGSRS
jgi:transposase